MARTQKNLGDILIDEGILSREELDDVLEKSRARNLTLEDTLFKLGYISRDKLGGLLAKLHGCEFIDLYSSRIEDDAIGMIPFEQALELMALPYALEGNTLSIAIASDSLKAGPLEEIMRTLERLSGKNVSIKLCNPGPLNEMLMRFCRADAGADAASSSGGEFASIVQHMKSDTADVTLRSRFEELYDIGQTALIGARSHPFSRAIAPAIEEARDKLNESKKYAESGFEEEAIETAKQAVELVRDAAARADAFERDWEKLLQEMKRLRTRISALESEGAADYAAAEFGRLSEISEGLLECANERNAEGLRSLIEQGTVLTDKVSLLEPERSKGREQVIASLTQVREVIARARNAGAREHAPDTLQEAYEQLDRAEAYARHAHWEDVRECLASAESKALEAERKAVNATKENERLTVSLRESIQAAMAEFEEALAHSFAHEVIENLMRAKDVITETKACFESDELERGIGLAQNIARKIKEEIVPLADEARRLWKKLFSRADAVSAQIQNIDIPLALKVAPEKMHLLFQSEREMVASLCERDRDRLDESITICEGLAEQLRQSILAAQDSLREAESVLEDVSSLLASTSASGIDESVAAIYDESRRMLDEARGIFEQGDAQAAMIRAQAAKAKLESDVIEPQDSARGRWSELSQRASEASKQIHSMNILLGLSIIPEKMERLFQTEREMVAALSAGDSERLTEAVAACEALIEEILDRLATASDSLKQVENVIAEVDSLLASAAAAGIEEVVAPAYEEARRLLDEAKSFFEGGDADEALNRAQAARVKIESDVIEPGNTAQREWNDLSQKAISVSEQIQSMNLPVVLRVAPEKMERLFGMERDMIGSLTERDRGRLSEAVSACERLAGDIHRQIADVREISNKAESSIEDAGKFLATAAASGIDEKVAAAYDESLRMLEEARSLFGRGDAETALDRAQTARVKLETQVLQLQDFIRREWIELSHRADRVLERARAVDMALAAKAATEQVDRLLETERNMAAALCERNSDALAEAVAICEGLVAEIEPAAAGLGELLDEAKAKSARLIEEVNSICTPDAMAYCPGLVNSLRINSAQMAAHAAANELPGLEASISTVESAIASIAAEVEAKKSRRHKELAEQLDEVERAVQDAVQRCSGNYSPDMLEDAYLDLNRIRDSLSAGPEALTAELDSRLARDLAVARTKVWQVEFMRERFEREREEVLRQLQLKLGAAREAIDTCAGLDFIDESSPLLQEARELLGHVDSLIIEGEIDASFEQIREVDALAGRIMAEAGQKEQEWRGLSERLMADDASHKSILSDPAVEKVSEEERRRLSELDAQTEAIRDSRDLGALKEHAQELTRGSVAVTGLIEAWKQENRTQVRAKLSDAGREIRLAELMGAKSTCPDVFSAAVTYLDIANTYLAKEDFDSAHPAVEDALEKSREASSLARASMQRESSLALDYMKIAAAHIEQQNLEAATEALRRGLSLAQSAAGEEAPPPDSEDS